jgi:hypothetical protein
VLRDTFIRYLVLDPTTTLYLKPDGTFGPWAAGDWTWISGPVDLTAGEKKADAFGIGPTAFPAEGIYTLLVQAVGTCGEPMDVLATTFDVQTDTDGDGWSDPWEDSTGTDPLDRDTDDDGILDPLDGDGDADGDRLIDALDCDADGDRLPDSVEAGLDGLSLDPDTDLAAGCFRPDGDAGASVTGRLLADSDGGGETDGDEDLDLDGVLDAGEKDPLDATDDPCSWTPPPEAAGLRLQRLGRSLLLSWDDLSAGHPCASYTVWSAADVLPDDIAPFSVIGSGLTSPTFLHADAAVDGSLRFYLTGASGRIGGVGPLGHYAQ